jgi:hypothetical protein
MQEPRKFPERRAGAVVRTSLVSFLLLATASCSLFTPNATIYYRSPEVSGVIVDADTGQPVDGVKVQVTWNSIRRTENDHNPDLVNFHTGTAITDTNGLFIIPAWGPMGESRKCHYYEYEPTVSLSQPDCTFSYQGLVCRFINNDNNQDSVTSSAWPWQTVTLDKPSWNGQRLRIHKDPAKAKAP